MSKYLPVRIQGSAAIAVCARCNMKMYYSDLQTDPNNGLKVCKDCKDLRDPWRLPARKTENISLQHPRPDVDIALAQPITWYTVGGARAAWVNRDGIPVEWTK